MENKDNQTNEQPTAELPISEQAKPESKVRRFFRKKWVQALLNPHMLISLGIAWFITNGWSYLAFGLGTYWQINWLRNIGAVWLGILWMPGTPEKLVTFSLAIIILRVVFPKDTKTLAIIHEKRLQLIELTKKSYQKFKDRFKKDKDKQPEQIENKDENK